jgi:ribonuclease HII
VGVNRSSYVVAIDENGMGPRLGPLVVTSLLVRVDEPGRKLATSRPRGSIKKRIGDSKKLVAFADSALGEAWARAIAARSGGPAATTPDELVAALAIDSSERLRAPCPSHHVDLCWNADGEEFGADDDTVATCTGDLGRLEAKGLHVLRARVAIVCTRALNDALDRGLSRFDVDLHTMERLVLAARADAGEDVLALCGKVGGFDFYSERFGPLAGRLHAIVVEGRKRSEYQMPGVGRIAFLRDADESHLVVGLASLVGKWARDHLMRRVVRFHRADEPGLPEASGYNDPITSRFIAASALVRKKRAVEPACFERSALWKNALRDPRRGKEATSSAPRARPSRGAASSSRSPRPS